MEPTKETASQEPRYSEAIAELEQILDQIENDEVDLDDLGGKVERAAELISLCRGKIERAELQVERIVTSLDAGGTDRDRVAGQAPESALRAPGARPVRDRGAADGADLS